MKNVFLIYQTDVWHTHASRELIAIGSTLENAITLIKEQMKKEGKKLNDDQKYLLQSIKQTQGYEGKSGEFLIEEMEVGKLF